MLQILSEKKRRAFYNTQLGKARKVLFEEKERNGYLYGHTENYVSVKTPYDPMLVNEILNFKLNSVEADGAVTGYEMVEGFKV